MDDIKVSLSIVIPGSQLYSEQVCSKNPKECTEHNQFTVEDKKTHKKEVIHYYTRKRIPARQSLKITKEAYDSMTDKLSCPEWEKMFIWSKMSRKQRLESHCKRICEGLNGVSFSYEILED